MKVVCDLQLGIGRKQREFHPHSRMLLSQRTMSTLERGHAELGLSTYPASSQLRTELTVHKSP